MNDITLPINQLKEKSKKLIDSTISTSTKRAYKSDWNIFVSWCEKYNVASLPASSETVSLWITSLEGTRSISTIRRYISSISVAHRIAGFDSPCYSDLVKRSVRGIAKTHEYNPTKAAPISFDLLKRIVNVCGITVTGSRNATMLLIGWTGALRRSELCSIRVEDIEFSSKGMILNIPKSKTDQFHSGYQIGIPSYKEEKYCAVSRAKAWIKRVDINEGYLFRSLRRDAAGLWIHNYGVNKPLSDRQVSIMIKKYIKKLGGNPSLYSGHSLRRGVITEAAASRVPDDIIQRHTRHLSIENLKNYIDRGTIFDENPISEIFLRHS